MACSLHVTAAYRLRGREGADTSRVSLPFCAMYRGRAIAGLAVDDGSLNLIKRRIRECAPQWPLWSISAGDGGTPASQASHRFVKAHENKEWLGAVLLAAGWSFMAAAAAAPDCHKLPLSRECRSCGAPGAQSAPGHVCAAASMSSHVPVALQVTMSLRFKTLGYVLQRGIQPGILEGRSVPVRRCAGGTPLASAGWLAGAGRDGGCWQWPLVAAVGGCCWHWLRPEMLRLCRLTCALTKSGFWTGTQRGPAVRVLDSR